MSAQPRIEWDSEGIRWYDRDGTLTFEVLPPGPDYEPPWLCGGCEDFRELHATRMEDR